MRNNEKSTLIIIPTLNEVESIYDLISKILRNYPLISILVVDDNSSDGTKNILKMLKSEHFNLHIINRKNRSGLGSAYREGFEFAAINKFSHIIQMDGDGSHQVFDLSKLINSDLKYDLVVGSRYINGGKIFGWKFSRRLISKTGNSFARFLIDLNTKDTTSGFKRLSKKVFTNKEILNSKTNGYSFQIEIVKTCEKYRLSILEIPIEFIEREYGISKFNLNIIIEAIKNILKWSIIANLFSKIKK